VTAEEKRDRRKARHQLQRCFRVIATKQIGFDATNKQITAATKIMADRYYAEQVRPTAARIEAELIRQAEAMYDKSMHEVVAKHFIEEAEKAITA
jgi:hypothetical protein